MSAALRNTLASIALAEGAAIMLQDSYRDRPRSKTVMRLTDNVITASQAAFRVWPDKLKRGELQMIARWLTRFEDEVFGQDRPFTVVSSLVLEVLEKLLSHLSNPAKIYAIENIYNRMLRLHKYYDRRLDRTEHYQFAAYAAELWYKLAE